MSMTTERETRQINRRFPTQLLESTIRLAYNGARMFGLLLLILGAAMLSPCVHAQRNGHNSWPAVSSYWSELNASMDKMHMAMGAVAQSGNSDVDFVRLMLPHHQAAIDMAKTQLLYGKDPQMRRLAQEIITDQQLEIELMQRWLKQQHTN
jgi:Domain of unknown function (DUF305)